MPRYRTISCEHCGFMQLKRDAYCDQCGRMTARERKKTLVNLVYFALLAVVLIFFYFYIQGVGSRLLQ